VKAWLTDQDAAAQAAFQEKYKPMPSADNEPVVTEETSDSGAVS
jgi:hypothetical protein